MRKKLIGILVCILFFGASVIPSISGNYKGIDKKVNQEDYIIKQKVEGSINPVNLWLEQYSLFPSDGETNDKFGYSVAIDGNYALIGVPLDDDIGSNSGSVYFFNRNVLNWTETQKITASDGKESCLFGWCVAIDGDYAIVGAEYDNNSHGYRAGAAYVFKRSGSTWTEEQKLIGSDIGSFDQFGITVALDGEYAIIGSKLDNKGAVYVFKHSESSWIQEQKLTASDPPSVKDFGSSVSIDGDYIIIGDNENYGNSSNSGAAYVFKRSGSTWTEEQKLIASDGEESDWFGSSVSIDGDTTVIGAYGDDDNGGNSGSVYVFKRFGSNWTEMQKLKMSDTGWFGHSVSIYSNVAIIGSPWDNYARGSSYIYSYNSSTSTWIEEQKLINSCSQTYEFFGKSVAIDSNYTIIGAPYYEEFGEDSGSAYIFTTEEINLPPEAPIIDGPTLGQPDIEYNYSFISSDPEGDNIYYYVNWGDGTSEIWIGPYNSGEEISLSHSWSNIGEYQIKTKAKNKNGTNSCWSSEQVVMDNYPDNPTIYGPNNGFPFISYPFTFISTDPDGDDVSYYIEWGDGKTTGWTTYYPSGSPGYTVSHSWIGIGKFIIKAKAKDIEGLESSWTEHTISIPKNRAINTPFLSWLQSHPSMFPLLQLLLHRFGL